MIFSSLEFLFIFLPLCITVYVFLVRKSLAKFITLFLALASIVFYAYGAQTYLWVILISIIVNYGVSIAIHGIGKQKFQKQVILSTGIIFNITVLFVFKYFNFFIENVELLFGNQDWVRLDLALPLGISFFTFQQIAYIVDVYAGKTERIPFVKYALFIVFFPQLIAGPIVH